MSNNEHPITPPDRPGAVARWDLDEAVACWTLDTAWCVNGTHWLPAHAHALPIPGDNQ